MLIHLCTNTKTFTDIRTIIIFFTCASYLTLGINFSDNYPDLLKKILGHDRFSDNQQNYFLSLIRGLNPHGAWAYNVPPCQNEQYIIENKFCVWT